MDPFLNFTWLLFSGSVDIRKLSYTKPIDFILEIHCKSKIFTHFKLLKRIVS